MTDKSIKVGTHESDTIQINLEFGEAVEDVHFLIKGSHVKCKVENRYLTSLAISDEGPHYDLLDWRHYESEWKDVSRSPQGPFLIGKYDGEFDSERFPDVTTEEIVGALPGNVDPRWKELASMCTSPTKMPCYVSVSHFEVRGNCQGDLTFLVRLHVPMGD